MHAEQSSSTGTIIDARDVHKTYLMGRVSVSVLRGVSLRVGEGEWLAVLGASGSGKSTLLHLLGGLDRPDAGERSAGVSGAIAFRGEDIHGLSAGALDRYRNQSVGFVFQFYHLLPELNVTENVLVPAMARWGRLGFMRRSGELRTRATDLLQAFGLGHRLSHRPTELSGGERQRVAIARALINNPPLLLADEPTGNLDRKTGEAILDQIAEQRRRDGRTLIMVTHDREIAGRADRIVELEDGRVASDQAGTPLAASARRTST